jgi:Kdo2-lipid IVA lauroyltransferase/acyltransferase
MVSKNIRNSFPDKNKHEIQLIIKKFYRHFFDVMVENIKLITISDKALLKKVTFKNFDIFDHYYQQKQSVITVLGHYGNWEFTTTMASRIKHQNLTLYKPLNNQFIDRLMIKTRSRYNLIPVPMNLALRVINEYNNKQTAIAVGFIADQRPMRKDIQYWTRFLNQETPVLLGIEKISKKYNYPVVFIKNTKTKRGHYCLEAIEIVSNPQNEAEYQITEKHLRTLEAIINEQPELWLWTHNRWKHERFI